MANNSLFQSIASGIREINKSKRMKAHERCVDYIAEILIGHTMYAGKASYTVEDLPKDIDCMLETANVERDWKIEEITQIILQSAKKAFGDPLITLQQKQLRQHCTQYYNPLAFPILIESMGIPDEEGKLIKYVGSGCLVNIPTGYTLGGRRSTVAGIAPQLLPCNIESQKDNSLDVTPVDFIEWIKYYPYQLTDCCNKAVQWSDAKQALVCSKCTTTVIIHTDKGLVWHS